MANHSHEGIRVDIDDLVFMSIESSKMVDAYVVWVMILPYNPIVLYRDFKLYTSWGFELKRWLR